MRRAGFTRVEVPREDRPRRPRITPNYIMRSLHRLPAFDRTTEIPTIDTWFGFRFRSRDYRFSRLPDASSPAR